MDIRRAIRGLGKTLITMGVLTLLFVAYQLWGTGLAEARSQDALTEQFRQSVGPTPPAAPSPDTPSPEPVVAPPPAPEGEAVAILKIPKLGVEKAVVEGVGLTELKKGPGHYPTTPMPGQPGNAAIAGHRTTYGAPFFKLDELARGDEILVTTRQGEFRYDVMDSKIVSPEETSVLDDMGDDRLTLTTCNPRYSAAQRLIVVAALSGEAAQPAQPAPEEPAAPAPPTSLEGTERAGLSGQGSPNGPAIAWGGAAAAVFLLTWMLSRAWRRWPAYLLGTPVFLVVLFFFFENFSRLLPSNF
ncbi:MAG: class E sortase [Actinomycetota bacterium]|nr:class E sortase [Actinomycetota bacterium]